MVKPLLPGPWQQERQRELDVALDTAACIVNMDPQEYRVTAHLALRRMLRRAKLGVLVPIGLLERVLADGRLKTQYETGFSVAGSYAPQTRRLTEHLLYGYPLDYQGSGPLHGLLFEDNEAVIAAVQCTMLGNYGQVLLELDPSLRRLSTVIAGDSMDNSGITDIYEWHDGQLCAIGHGSALRAPCRLQQPDLVCAGDLPLTGTYPSGVMTHKSVDDMILYKPAGMCRYWEVAIHAPVPIEKIKRLYVPSHLSAEVEEILAAHRAGEQSA